MTDFAAITDDIERDLDAERYEKAIERAKELDLEACPADDWERLMPIVLRCRRYGGEPADKIVVATRGLIDRARPGRARALLHAEIAYCLIEKRVPELAAAEAAKVVSEWPEGSLGDGVRGWAALQFDRRDECEAAYRDATAKLEPARGWLGLARIRYVEGDFDGALAALEQIGEAPRYQVAKLRVAADVARVRGDWPAFLKRIDQILELTPGGDRRRHDLLDRASALCAAGRRDEGIEVYRALWREDEKDSPGRFARAVLDHVDRGAGGTRLMLPKFPTVTQKRNYCGPATLELVLRSLGIDVDQDDIAPAVKRERGSTILAMCRYLESKGLVTRRFEGDGPRFRACIEQGLPVIVEEEYSTTSHVAVVIGVDESLGLLFVQDPMTHVTSERQIKTQGTLGAMYRNAAIVALRPGDDLRAEALDKAGVVDSEHLRLVDSCNDDDIAKDNEEVLRRCDRALELVEDYPLAWYRRTSCLMSQYYRYRTGNNRDRFVMELRRARVRYHDQEWPHLLHASYLMDSERHEEALIELENALRIDPHDSNTAQDVAECHMQQGRGGEATEAFWRTLGIDASHVRATENFAGHALDQGDVEVAEHLSACALEMSPQNPFNHVTASRAAEKRGRSDDALAHARKAIEVAPEYVYGPLRVAELLRKVGTDDARAEAIDLYLKLVTKRPYWFEPRWRGARELERAGRVEEGAELLIAGLEIAQDEPVVLVRNLAEILIEAGDDERAATLVGQFARQRPTASMLERWWDTLDDCDRWSEAVEASAEFLASNQDSPFASANRASRIYGIPEHDEEAERLLRHAVGGAPTYGWARRMLGDFLVRDRRDEAIELMADAPAGDDWNSIYQASYLSWAGRHDDALGVLITVDDASWTTQEVWNRIRLRDEDAAVALDRTLRLEGARDRRAALAFAVAAQAWPTAEQLFAELDVADPIGQYMCHAACTSDDRFRAELDRRIDARLAKDPEHNVRRYLLAVKAGNRAAQGDREAFDHAVANEKNVQRLTNLATTLTRARHAELLRPLREALAQRTDRSAGILAGAELAEMDRDHARSAAVCEALVAKLPRDGAGWAHLVLAKLMLGDVDAARAAADRAMKLPTPWVHVLEVAAAVALIDGDRDRASVYARQGRIKAAASGYGGDVYPVLLGVEAALASDAARLERARTLSHDPDGAVWQRLAERLTPAS
ncbi:MAG TPA: C39 family peptidase [Kofleriaceae bacterium]|nr:C39 family peptidase [Kofleriaceae bacterium]